ncbi:MAG: DUF2800 domain-containing protein [Clostridiales bacterium]|jgi:hypothetical protein|nr:DUF2800 domain-containing protein [Clostridiales bacterium]
MGKHALLSASSSHRWISCPPSARLGTTYEDKGSGYAAEGTDAHALCEYKLRFALGKDMSAADIREHLDYYSDEMEDCAGGYAAYIIELVETAKQTCSDPQVLIEQKLDFSKYVEDGFGTGDCVVIADGTLHIVDYKHGQGVLVEAADNPQMKLYALGALELFDGIYDIDTVSMTIYQPRRDNVSTHTVFKESLYQWAEEVLKPAAELAFAGGGEYQCGEWCQFCKAKYDCRKRAETNMELACHDFKRPPLLEDDEIESILGKIDALVSWASDIKDYTLQAALSGKKWQGWKLVEGRSNRKYVSEEAVAQTVTTAGYDPYEHKVMGITTMEKTLGKAKFSELLGGLVEKPQGKPTLVPEGDKRPAIHTAADDFADQENL